MASTGSSGGGGSSATAPARGGRGFGRRGSRTPVPPGASNGGSRGAGGGSSRGQSKTGSRSGSYFGRLGCATAPARTGVLRGRGVAARFSRLRSRLRLFARFCPVDRAYLGWPGGTARRRPHPRRRRPRREQGGGGRRARPSRGGRRDAHGAAPRSALGDLLGLLPRPGRAPLG